MYMNTRFVLAASLLTNTIIGAGIFSLPFVFYTVGILRGVSYLLFFAFAYSALHLMYAELLKEAGGAHDLPYLAGAYVGKKAKVLVGALLVIELLLVMFVYLALIPSFFEGITKIEPGIIALIFWGVSTLFIFADIDWLEHIATISVSAMLLILLTVFGFSLTHGTPLSLNAPPLSLPVFFIPFGPLLFALSGRPGIGKLVEAWERAKHGPRSFSLAGAIIAGTLVAAIAYFLFVIAVLRISPTPSADAVSGVIGVLPQWAVYLLCVLGVTALWNVYFMMGSNVRDVLNRDFKTPELVSSAVVTFVPLLLYYSGVGGYAKGVSIVGGLFLALEGIIIVSLWSRAKQRAHTRWIVPILYVVFLLAIAYQVRTMWS